MNDNEWSPDFLKYESQGIGFVFDSKRLNVSVTNARLGMILVTNPYVHSKKALWDALFLHLKENDTLVECLLNNLQMSYITFDPFRVDEKVLSLSQRTIRHCPILLRTKRCMRSILFS